MVEGNRRGGGGEKRKKLCVSQIGLNSTINQKKTGQGYKPKRQVRGWNNKIPHEEGGKKSGRSPMEMVERGRNVGRFLHLKKPKIFVEGTRPGTPLVKVGQRGKRRPKDPPSTLLQNEGKNQ